jgi:hypothetical protein
LYDFDAVRKPHRLFYLVPANVPAQKICAVVQFLVAPKLTMQNITPFQALRPASPDVGAYSPRREKWEAFGAFIKRLPICLPKALSG